MAEPVFDSESGELFGKLFSGIADYSARLNQEAVDSRQERIDALEVALKRAMRNLSIAVDYVGVRSEAGQIIDSIHDDLYRAYYRIKGDER